MKKGFNGICNCFNLLIIFMPDFYSVNERIISIRRLINGVNPPIFQWLNAIAVRKIVIVAGLSTRLYLQGETARRIK